MKKGFVLLLVSLFLIPYLGSSYASDRKKKKKAPIEQKNVTPKKPISKYEKLFKGKQHQAFPGKFATIHRVGDKIYLEYPLKYMGRDLLIALTPSATSDPSLVNVGYKNKGLKHVRFVLKDSMIFMNDCSTYTTYDDTEEMKETAALNFMDVRKQKFKLETYNRDSTAVIFEAGKIFLDDAQSPIGGSYKGLPITGKVKAELSTIGKIKSFDDNISVETENVYSCSAKQMFSTFMLGEVLVKTVKTMFLLPEEAQTH